MLNITQLIGFGCGGCDCTPAYVTGDRTASITVTQDSTNTFRAADSITNSIDGDYSQTSAGGNVFASNFAVDSTHWIRWQFSTLTKVTEARWYQNDANTHGNWKWQGSNDATNFVDIGTSFTLGGTNSPTGPDGGQVHTELNGNTSGYFYYQLIGVSGNANSIPFITEVEFKQCSC